MVGKVYIVSGKRTPFGKFGGSFKDIPPVDLAVFAAKSLLEEQKINPDKIDHVILGSVIPSSTDTLYGGRHLALKVGAPIKTPGYLVNRLCGSGIQAIADAARLIKLGEAHMVLAAGTENMSMAPHLTYGARFGGGDCHGQRGAGGGVRYHAGGLGRGTVEQLPGVARLHGCESGERRRRPAVASLCGRHE